MKLNLNELIHIKTVQQLIPNTSKTVAWKMIAVCRSALNKEKPKILTVRDFVNYYGITHLE